MKPWQSLFNGRVLAFNGVIDIETRAKAKALGIVARTAKNFTGLEIEGKEKIYVIYVMTLAVFPCVSFVNYRLNSKGVIL